MGIVTDAARRLGVVNGLFAFLWRKRLWWMIPILLAVLAVAFIVTMAGHPAAAPFIYTLF
jgi:predicted membrane metal-binding protein